MDFSLTSHGDTLLGQQIGIQCSKVVLLNGKNGDQEGQVEGRLDGRLFCSVDGLPLIGRSCRRMRADGRVNFKDATNKVQWKFGDSDLKVLLRCRVDLQHDAEADRHHEEGVRALSDYR